MSQTTLAGAAGLPAPRAWRRLSTADLILTAFLTLVVARALLMLPAMDQVFVLMDNDDLFRLEMVRDWLAGQSWWDSRQYRLLPPEGVSMHWSRYVDAGIAALLVPLSWVMPMAAAEMAAVTFWPTALLAVLLTLVARGSDRIGGPLAALGAVVFVLAWSKLFKVEFAPGRIDHHNVQIVACTAIALLSVLPARRPVLSGALAGGLAALSLAVGLEMIPVIALAWALAGLRFAWGAPGSAGWLAGFAAAAGLGAPALLAGQTPWAEIALMRCDALGLPILSLTTIGAAATLIPVALSARLRGPLPRVAAMLAIAGAGFALCWPMLGTCLAGPYGAMTPEARAIIADLIVEAQPALALIADRPDMVNRLLVPVIVVILAAAGLGWQAWPRLSRVQRLALVQMLAFGGTGLALGLIQIRALNAAVPAIPFLAGFVVWRLVELARSGRHRLAAVLVLVVCVPAYLPTSTMALARSLQILAPAQAAALAGMPCRSQAVADAIQALPPSTVLTSLNLGALVLNRTTQAATSAPYHRSDDAFANGILPYRDAAAMVAALRRSGAGHVVVCQAAGPDSRFPFANALIAGNVPDWLIPLASDQDEALILAVDPARLGALP